MWIMWPNIALSAFLLALAAILIALHIRQRRAAHRRQIDQREWEFLRRQFRRRCQASAMIAVVGAAVLAGSWIQNPLTQLFYWSGVFLLVCWIVLLAISDAVNTRVFFYRERMDQLVEHAALQAELKTLRSRKAHGQRPRDSEEAPSAPPSAEESGRVAREDNDES